MKCCSFRSGPRVDRIAVPGLVAALAFSLLFAGCKSPSIVSLTATSPNDPVLRTGNVVKFAADVRLSGAVVQTSDLTLQRMRPAGAEIVRPLVAESTGGDTTRYSATVLPADPAITFQPGDLWRATVKVGYSQSKTSGQQSLVREIEIFEPAGGFSFVGSNPTQGWRVLKYHKFTPPYGQETAFGDEPQLQAYPAENYPKPRAGDYAIGFPITLSPHSRWNTAVDNWSAIVVSPPVKGWTVFGVSVKTEVPGLSLLSYVDVVTDPGSGNFRSVPLIVSPDGARWYGRTAIELIPATETEGWHTYYFTTTGTELPAGSIRAVHLEVFGPKDGLAAAQGKVVLIDQVIGR